MSRPFTVVGVRTGGGIHKSLFTVVTGQKYDQLYTKSSDSGMQLT